MVVAPPSLSGPALPISGSLPSLSGSFWRSTPAEDLGKLSHQIAPKDPFPPPRPFPCLTVLGCRWQSCSLAHLNRQRLYQRRSGSQDLPGVRQPGAATQPTDSRCRAEITWKNGFVVMPGPPPLGTDRGSPEAGTTCPSQLLSWPSPGTGWSGRALARDRPCARFSQPQLHLSLDAV